MSCPAHFYHVFCKGACFNHSFAILSCVFCFASGICVFAARSQPHLLGAYNDEPTHATWLADRPAFKHSFKPKNDQFCQEALSFFGENLLAIHNMKICLRDLSHYSSAHCSGFLFVLRFVCHCFCFCVLFFLIRFHKPSWLVKKKPSKAMTRLRSVLKGCTKQIRKIGWLGCRGRYADWTSGDEKHLKTKQGPSGNFATNKQHPQTTDIVTSTNHAHNTWNLNWCSIRYVTSCTTWGVTIACLVSRRALILSCCYRAHLYPYHGILSFGKSHAFACVFQPNLFSNDGGVPRCSSISKLDC